jgi:pimeloyl-ACP methyl ester carboxylesterase
MLIDTRAKADAPEAAAGREESARAVLKAGDPGSVIAAMIPKLFGKATQEQSPGLIAALKADMDRNSASGVAGALRGMAIRPDRRDQLASIAAPTLVVVGEDDAIAPPDEARAMAEALPNARLEIVPTAGHMSPCENPEAFNRAVLRFLRELG